MIESFVLFLAAFVVVDCDVRETLSLDLLFTNGRVIDPHSKTDKILNVGINHGKIVYLNENIPNDMNSQIKKVIDISGMILCPGFIDIHAHHQSIEGNYYQARDGVTTSMELEFGVYPIHEFYDKRKNEGSLLNYGASVGHIGARLYRTGMYLSVYMCVYHKIAIVRKQKL